MRVTFQPDYGDGATVYDAEFFFLPADEVVALRCAARDDAVLGEPRVSFTVERGLRLESNGSAVLLEDLRRALGWEEAPVLTEWDPRVNVDEPLWFEQGFEAVGLAPKQRNP